MVQRRANTVHVIQVHDLFVAEGKVSAVTRFLLLADCAKLEQSSVVKCDTKVQVVPIAQKVVPFVNINSSMLVRNYLTEIMF